MGCPRSPRATRPARAIRSVSTWSREPIMGGRQWRVDERRREITAAPQGRRRGFLSAEDAGASQTIGAFPVLDRAKHADCQVVSAAWTFLVKWSVLTSG